MRRIIKEKHYGLSMRSVYLIEFEEGLRYKLAICDYDKKTKTSSKIIQSFYYNDLSRAEEAYEIILEGIL